MTTQAQTQPETTLSRRRIAKNASIYLVFQIVSWALTLLNMALLPRLLGKTVYGQWALIMGLFAPVGFLALGLEQYLVKELGRDRSRTSELLSAALGIRFAVLPLFLLGGIFTLWTLQLPLTVERIGIFVLVGYLPFWIAELFRATLAGWEDAKRVSLIDLTAGIGLFLSLPFLRYGLLGVFVPLLLILYLSLWVRWRWVTEAAPVRPRYDKALWRELVLGGLPFVANMWILQVYAFAATFLLKRLSGEDSVGVYSAALRLFGAFMFFPTALSYALLPALSRLSSSHPEEVKEMQSRVLGLLIILALPLIVLTYLLADPLCALVFGAKYPEVPMVVRAYVFNIIPVYIVSTMYQFLVAQNRNTLWTGFLLLSVGIFCGAAWMLIPWYATHWNNGAVGAVVAGAISETCSSLVALVLLRSNPFHRRLVGRLIRAAVATAGMGGVVWLTRSLFIALPAALGLLTFGILAWGLRVLTPDEQEKIIGLVRQKLLRR